MARKRSKRQLLPLKVCRSCDKTFQPYREYQRYCSGPCRNKFWRTKNRSIRITTDRLDAVESQVRDIMAVLLPNPSKSPLRRAVDAGLRRELEDLEARVKAMEAK